MGPTAIQPLAKCRNRPNLPPISGFFCPPPRRKTGVGFLNQNKIMKAPRRFLIAAIATVALAIGLPAQAHAHGGCGGWHGGGGHYAYHGGGHSYYHGGYYHGWHGGYYPRVYYSGYYPYYSYPSYYYSSYSPYDYDYGYPYYGYGYPYYYGSGVTFAVGGHRYGHYRGYYRGHSYGHSHSGHYH